MSIQMVRRMSSPNCCLSDTVEARLVQRFPRREFSGEVVHGRGRRRMKDLAQIVQVSRIRIWLEMLRQATVDLETVRHVVLPDDGVGVSGGLLSKHGLQLVDNCGVNGELCELILEDRRHLVL